VRIEILEDKKQSMPVRNEHVHFFLPDAEIPKAQAWYAKTFGGKEGIRNGAPVVDIPGVQLRFSKADMMQAPTRGRVRYRVRGPTTTDAGGGEFVTVIVTASEEESCPSVAVRRKT
jgi:hypothetical protein